MPHAACLVPLPLVLWHEMQEPKSQPDQPTERQGGGAPGNTATGQQPGPPPQGPSQGLGQQCGTETWLMLGLFVALMWLLVLRPESRRRKQTQQMLAAVKQGDRIVTIGGMHAVVGSLGDKTVTLRVDNVKMVIDRSAIARVERDEPQKDEGRKS